MLEDERETLVGVVALRCIMTCLIYIQCVLHKEHDKLPSSNVITGQGQWQHSQERGESFSLVDKGWGTDQHPKHQGAAAWDDLVI